VSAAAPRHNAAIWGNRAKLRAAVLLSLLLLVLLMAAVACSLRLPPCICVSQTVLQPVPPLQLAPDKNISSSFPSN
jgi:hypothetical protein